VIIRSEEGCESEELFTVEVVEVSDLLVDLVNFISPNGDGKNDFLFFNGLENYKTSQLSIFNRWGDLLFNKINYQGDGTYWEATYKGQPLPAGVYYYVLRLGQIDEPIRSSLTIVRN
jgi:gliding motility-associated-like protein